MFGVVSLHGLLEALDELLILASFLELLHDLLQVPLSSTDYQPNESTGILATTHP